MQDKIKILEYNLRFLIHWLERMVLSEYTDYEVLQKIRQINEKVYELADVIEELEVLLE